MIMADEKGPVSTLFMAEHGLCGAIQSLSDPVRNAHRRIR